MSSTGSPTTSLAAPSGRAVCARCRRPVGVCWCGELVRIETRTRVVILQHPREAKVPIGTARMAHLALAGSRLHVGLEWDGSAELANACGDPGRPPVLLWPGPGARDVVAEPPAGPVTLIVVDGTWPQARALVRRNPELALLPRYGFRPPEPSHYRIRREPRAEYVSTLEALVHVLGVLEGDAGRFQALRRPMDTMVDAQIAAQERHRTPRFARPRNRRGPAERLPAELTERFEDLVLVFGDANAWPRGTPEHALGAELVHWVALRPATGETFEFVLAPRLPLSPEAPHNTGLSEATLRAGGTPEELAAAFAAFTRPTDVLASWGAFGVNLLRACGVRPPEAFVDLRRAASALTNARNGPLERYAAATVDAPPPPDLPPGRAGRRLGLLDGILATWRGLPGR